MKKRILSLVLSVIMLITTVPFTASAADFSAKSVVSSTSDMAITGIQKLGGSGSDFSLFEWFIGLFGYFKVKDEAKLRKAAGKNYSHEYTIKKDLTLSDTIKVTGTLNICGKKTIKCNKTCFEIQKNGKFSSKEVTIYSESAQAIKNSGNCTIYGGTYKANASNAVVIWGCENSVTTINGGTFNNPNNTDLFIEGPNAKAYYNNGETNEARIKPNCALYMTGGHIGTIYKEGEFVNNGGKYDKLVSNTDSLSTLTISLTSPANNTKITLGSSLGIHGKISSNYKITKVEGYIQNSSGTKVQSTSCTPNATSLTIDTSAINNNLVFDKITAAGTYTLVIKATDASGKTAEKKVTVTIQAVSSTFMWPLRTSAYITGLDVYGGSGSEHWGIDIAADYGTAVYAVCEGTVTGSGFDDSFGNYIKIEHTVNNQKYTSVYAHLSSRSVSANTKVTTGTVIGKVGSTGDSTGNHLHLEIFPGSYSNRSHDLSKHTFEYYMNNISQLKQYVKYFSGTAYGKGIYKNWFSTNCYISGSNYYLNK